MNENLPVIYVSVLLFLLSITAFFVLRQIIKTRRLENTFSKLQKKLKEEKGTAKEYYELGSIYLDKKLFTPSVQLFQKALKSGDLEADEDEHENNEQEDYFGNSQQSPDIFTHKVAHKTEHLKDIRNLFLKLADKYHPDKTHEENRDMYTEIMKEINLAYKSGDYARLVELEKQLLQEEICLEKAADYDQIKHLEVLKKKIEILKSQLESIKLQFSKVKKTPPGEMTLEYQKALKQGINIIDLMYSQLESRASVLQRIRDFVQDFKDKKITIKRFVEGPDLLYSLENFDEIDELINSLF